MIEALSGNENPNLQIDMGEVRGTSPSTSSKVNISGDGISSTPVQQPDSGKEIANKNGDVKSENVTISEEEIAKLEESIEKLNEKMNMLNRELHFKVDKKIGKDYISIINKDTKEIIKEFPPKEIRTFIARMRDYESGSMSRGDLKNLLVNLEV